MILDNYLKDGLNNKYQVINEIRFNDFSDDTFRIKHNNNKTYIIDTDNDIEEFDYTKNYDHITKLLTYYNTKTFTDYSIFPNLKFLYIHNSCYDGELTGINKDIDYIILNQCEYFKTKYIPNLKMLYCSRSLTNDTRFDLTVDYHKYKKDNIDWCKHPALLCRDLYYKKNENDIKQFEIENSLI